MNQRRWVTVSLLVVACVAFTAVWALFVVVVYMVLMGGAPPFIHGDPSIPG
jgi:hypothetical protein